MKFRRQRRDEVGVNLTPLIDVVFLLLIFFMVSTTFTRETQLSIDLPEASGQPQETTDERIEILIDESGSYRVNGQALVDARLRTLMHREPARFDALHALSRDLDLTLRATGDLSEGDLERLRNLGYAE